MNKTIETDIYSLIPDDKNFNKGTEYGGHLLDKSLRQYGMGRSILVDKNNRIIAGNKTTETAMSIGIEKVRIIETTGNEIIAVKRTDIDLGTKRGREMAMADNATSEKNLQWDEEVIQEVAEKLEMLPDEWGIEIEGEGDVVEVEEGQLDLDGNYIRIRCKRGEEWKVGNVILSCGDTIELEELKQILKR